VRLIKAVVELEELEGKEGLVSRLEVIVILVVYRSFNLGLPAWSQISPYYSLLGGKEGSAFPDIGAFCLLPGLQMDGRRKVLCTSIIACNIREQMLVPPSKPLSIVVAGHFRAVRSIPICLHKVLRKPSGDQSPRWLYGESLSETQVSVKQ